MSGEASGGGGVGDTVTKASPVCPKCKAEGKETARAYSQAYCPEHVARYHRERRNVDKQSTAKLRQSMEALVSVSTTMQRDLADVRARVNLIERLIAPSSAPTNDTKAKR